MWAKATAAVADEHLQDEASAAHDQVDDRVDGYPDTDAAHEADPLSVPVEVVGETGDLPAAADFVAMPRFSDEARRRCAEGARERGSERRWRGIPESGRDHGDTRGG